MELVSTILNGGISLNVLTRLFSFFSVCLCLYLSLTPSPYFSSPSPSPPFLYHTHPLSSTCLPCFFSSLPWPFHIPPPPFVHLPIPLHSLLPRLLIHLSFCLFSTHTSLHLSLSPLSLLLLPLCKHHTYYVSKQLILVVWFSLSDVKDTKYYLPAALQKADMCSVCRACCIDTKAGNTGPTGKPGVSGAPCVLSYVVTICLSAIVCHLLVF